MQKRRERVLQAFLSRCSEERRGALERFLPESERLALKSLAVSDVGERGEEKATPSLVDQVHWSWFLPTLKSYPEREQRLFLCSLKASAAYNLAHELGLPNDEEQISKSGRFFLRQILLHSLVGAENHLLPIDFLPPSPLHILLPLHKKELTHLIDLLSLYDLAQELRQIVETKILKKIYSFLTDDERKFLKTAAIHKEPYSVPRLGFDRWDGTKESFRVNLHRRGIARLGAALSGQDPDLIWYLCHQLDIGRGTALHKLCLKEAMPEISEWVIRQIEELLANPGMAL